MPRVGFPAYCMKVNRLNPERPDKKQQERVWYRWARELLPVATLQSNSLSVFSFLPHRSLNKPNKRDYLLIVHDFFLVQLPNCRA